MRGRSFTRKLCSHLVDIEPRDTVKPNRAGEEAFIVCSKGETLGNLPQSSKNGDIFKAKDMSIFIKGGGVGMRISAKGWD